MSEIFCSKLPYRSWSRSAIDMLAGLLRLSRKYEADDLYSHYMLIFRNAWPDVLSKWDTRETELLQMWVESDNEAGPFESQIPDPGMSS